MGRLTATRDRGVTPLESAIGRVSGESLRLVVLTSMVLQSLIRSDFVKLMKLKVFITTMSRAFVFKAVPTDVDSWQANVTVTREPKRCYISLERWGSIKA
jgi:hypothetical protein